jgi:hypothetical protein
MTTDIQKYIDWARGNNGTVSITINNYEMKRRDTPIEVWCYNYDVSHGTFVKLGEDPPTIEWLRARKEGDLQAQLDRLKDQAAELERRIKGVNKS